MAPRALWRTGEVPGEGRVVVRLVAARANRHSEIDDHHDGKKDHPGKQPEELHSVVRRILQVRAELSQVLSRRHLFAG